MRSPSLLVLPIALWISACTSNVPAAGPVGCDVGLDAYCSGHSCVREWSAVTPSCSNLLTRSYEGSCFGFDFLEIGSVDTAETRWYDHATGQLIAITSYSNHGVACETGPSTFDVPDCGRSAVLVCPDAGPDAHD